VIQNPDDLPLSARLGAKAERESIGVTNPVLVWQCQKDCIASDGAEWQVV
jgi:hypothetical protein